MTRVRQDRDGRFESKRDETVARPTLCPFCKGKAVGTLAKVITATTCWRCRDCEKTWTIASQTSARKL